MSLFRIDAKQPVNGPHQGQPVHRSGTELSKADAAMIMIHGRGASAEGILSLASQLQENNLHFLAPSAAGHTWYPYSFLYPRKQNEAGLHSALQVIHDLIKDLVSEGLTAERVILLGFSQGACLVSEYAARHPARYGGIVALSGGLIGDTVLADDYSGSLEQTPVFLGCSDVDPHIPLERVNKTAGILKKLKADVTKNIYPGMAHTVNSDELSHINRMVHSLSK